MYTLAVVIHVLVCCLMIASILLQSGKGAEIGAAFGGSSQTVFGSRGPGTFLSKVTVAAAMVLIKMFVEYTDELGNEVLVARDPRLRAIKDALAGMKLK